MNQENTMPEPEKPTPPKSGPGLMPLIVVAIVVIAAVGGMFAYNVYLKPEPALVTATVSIDYGNGTVISKEIGSSNNTALGLLRTYVGEENVEASTFGFITSINGHTETSDMFWMYYVNGEMPMESAATIEIHDGDLVEFKFEASPWG